MPIIIYLYQCIKVELAKEHDDNIKHMFEMIVKKRKDEIEAKIKSALPRPNPEKPGHLHPGAQDEVFNYEGEWYITHWKFYEVINSSNPGNLEIWMEGLLS